MAGQQPAPPLPPPNSLGGFTSAYDGPIIGPAYQVTDYHWKSKNTTNGAYPVAMVEHVARWPISRNDLNEFLPLWNLQYIPHTLPGRFRPLDDVLDRTYPCVFDNEATLAMRLESTVLLTAGRILSWIDHSEEARRQNGHPSLLPLPGPLGALPLLMEHGAVANQQLGDRKFLPDRCGLPKNDMYSAIPAVKPRAFLFGDIKPSYKFRGIWGWSNARDKKYLTEFRKVAAQLKFYMIALGWHDYGEEKASIIYGYVITDLEVVLLKRSTSQRDTIYVSQPFKLRAADRVPPAPGTEDPDDYGISGMTALIYIHLLASNHASHSANCRNETNVTDDVAGIVARPPEDEGEDAAEDEEDEEEAEDVAVAEGAAAEGVVAEGVAAEGVVADAQAEPLHPAVRRVRIQTRSHTRAA